MKKFWGSLILSVTAIAALTLGLVFGVFANPPAQGINVNLRNEFETPTGPQITPESDFDGNFLIGHGAQGQQRFNLSVRSSADWDLPVRPVFTREDTQDLFFPDPDWPRVTSPVVSLAANEVVQIELTGLPVAPRTLTYTRNESLERGVGDIGTIAQD